MRKSLIPRVHRQTLVRMNLPVFTARRDAAHALVLAILAADPDPGTKAERTKLYARLMAIIDEAVMATQRSQLTTDTPLLHYLDLLRETMAACLAMVRHELRLDQEAIEFSRMLPPEAAAQLKAADRAFAVSEKNILGSVRQLLGLGERLVEHDSRRRLTRFSADDRRRYAVARREYDDFYANYEVTVAAPGDSSPQEPCGLS
ncbi:MAG: hypothetical protein PHR35_21795 [Kiritimatiellae bacterium]|nr:hypothetical protein [Kiritimatiellia bacterium]